MLNSRLIERQNAMSILYIHLLRHQSIKAIIEDNEFITEIGDFTPDLSIKREMLEVIERAIERQEIYELAMNQYLKKWRFDRLSFIEQAILLIACAELELGYQEKPIIVNEAVRLAKEFGDDESYKFINGVLDAIW